MIYLSLSFGLPPLLICFCFQAGNFLISAQSHGSSQERELEENVFSRKEDYGEGASLLEQVVNNFSVNFTKFCLFLSFVRVVCN